MSTQYDILIKAKADVSGAASETNQMLDNIDTKAKKASASLSKTGEQSANFGKNMAKGLMVAQSSLDILAPSLGKLAPEFDAAIRGAQQLAGALTMGASFGGIGIAIAVLTAGLGMVITEMTRVGAETAKAMEPINNLKKSLSDLGLSSEPIAKQLQEVTGVTRAQAEAMAEAAKNSTEYRNSLLILVDQAGKIKSYFAQFKHDQGGLQAFLPQISNEFIDKLAADAIAKQEAFIAKSLAKQAEYENKLKSMTGGFTAMVESLNGSLAKLKVDEMFGRFGMDAELIQKFGQSSIEAAQKVLILAEAMAKLALVEAQINLAISTGQTGGLQGLYQMESDLRTLVNNLSTSVNTEAKSWEYNTGAKERNRIAAEKLAAAYKALQDRVKAMVETALTPTEVTQEDLDAAKVGKYTNKWDEFRRRGEDVLKNGVDPAKYGDKFAQGLKALEDKTGLALDKLLEKYKDFSLFADKEVYEFAKSIGAVDIGAAVADVTQQIDAAIGQARLLQDAFNQVWASMSTQKKLDLANALGIEGLDASNVDKAAGTIQKAITNPMGGAESAVKGLNTAITGVPTAHSTTFNILKAKDFDTTLQQILDDINKIPSAADVVVTMTYENRGGAGGNTDPNGNPTNNMGGGRAVGGSVFPWMSYLVGETGPELFRPKVPGEIYSHTDSQKLLSGIDWGQKNVQQYFSFNIQAVNFEQLMRQVRAYAKHAL